MKALTAKSKNALLVFLSALTLTLVLTASLPARIHHTFTKSEITQILVSREIKKLPQTALIVIGVAIFALEVLPKFSPWTGSVLARGPPF